MFEGMGDAGEAPWRLGGWGVGRAWGQKSGFPSLKLDLFSPICHTDSNASDGLGQIGSSHVHSTHHMGRHSRQAHSPHIVQRQAVAVSVSEQ